MSTGVRFCAGTADNGYTLPVSHYRVCASSDVPRHEVFVKSLNC